MTKKIWVITLLALFLLTSLAFARVSDGTDGQYKKAYDASKPMLFEAPNDYYDNGMPAKMYFPTRDYTPAGNIRQVYGTETTQHDRQHYSTPGRQIIYAGYWNANCDYVFMNWSGRSTVGSTIILQCKVALFDWGFSQWDFAAGGAFQAGPLGSFQNLPYTFAPNIDITTDNLSAVVSMSVRNDAEPKISYVAYGDLECPTASFQTAQRLPGPPNLQGVTNGYCDENLGDEEVSPYLWPILDIDTTDDGKVITHVVNQEWGFCDEVPDDELDAASLVYHRKVADAEDLPGGGTWVGPTFIDSVYNIGYVVRADKRPGNHTVYLAYLKPVYYKHNGDDGHYCGYTYNAAYQLTNEMVYKVSNDDGATWGTTNYVTDYLSGFEDDMTEPAVYDISGMVDPTGTFHLVWVSPNHDEACSFLYASRMWHWDNFNNCISVVYDASHPASVPSTGNINAWNWTIAKPNISWCDDKLYVVFSRFGAHPDSEDDDVMGDVAASTFLNTDLLLVCSDDDGGMGQVWSDAVNITNTETNGCASGECESEHWPTMAMYSTDSLMIEYILDLEAGGKADPNDPNDATLSWTDNPVIFMTWPCFAMADLDQNICVSTNPSSGKYDEVALAPNGNPSGCTTPATYTADVTLSNCGNVNLTYSAVSDAAWLTINSGSAGSINAGTGPNYSSNAAWTGAPGCASPALINWTASSASLGQGNYTGHISVDVDNPSIDDFDITINLVVACEYYLPDSVYITGGCWTIALWNTPQAATQNDDDQANMKFYACGDTINPLYHEAFIIGWQTGGTKYVYSDAICQDSTQYHMRALTDITPSSVGDPANGEGYYQTIGYWSTPDSIVQGKIEYFIPGHQDTSVLIEKVTFWNRGSAALSNVVIGEESDWDIDRDSSLDAGGIDTDRDMIYQHGDHNDEGIYAGLSVYGGTDATAGGEAVNGYDYAYSSLGWYPDTLYNKLVSLSGTFTVFADSTNGTEMRVLNRFRGGTLPVNDTIEICKVKAVSLDGLSGLQELIDKGFAFIEKYELCEPPPDCVGRCGDANNDGVVNVSDAVKVINYVFIGGTAPVPVLACGDANDDGVVNVSDAVKIINYVFIGGGAPGDCHIEAPAGGLPCCAF